MADRNNGSETSEIHMAEIYLEAARGILIVLNKNGVITEINRAGSEQLGYPKAEITGKNWFTSFIPGRVREVLISNFQKMIAGDIPVSDFESPVLTRDGREPLISWRSLILRDKQGDTVGLVSSGDDVTERKKVQDASNQYRERLEAGVADRTADYSQASSKLGIAIMERDQAEKGLRLRAAMLENLPEPIFLIDLAGNLVFVNEAGVKMFEFERSRLIGIAFWELVQPQSKDVIEAALRDLQEKREIQYETYYIKKDGSQIPLLVHSVVIKIPDGEYILSVVHDTRHPGRDATKS